VSITWVALLRGINVGRNKRVSMSAIRGVLTSLGYADVRTHGQSGNAVFVSDQRKAARIEADISAKIKHELGMDVVVLLRTGRELAAVVDANPFVGGGAAASELHVAFLAQAPIAAAIRAIDRDACAPDEFAVGERAIYLRLPNGNMGSRLPNLERALGVRVTQRNWNTTLKVRDLAS
jgi:uncharacterized protein (DUF1697 family)